jgi:hypothetical protein
VLYVVVVAALANAANSAINNIFLIRSPLRPEGLRIGRQSRAGHEFTFGGVQQNVQMTIDLISDSSDSALDRGEHRQAAGAIAKAVIRSVELIVQPDAHHVESIVERGVE